MADVVSAGAIGGHEPAEGGLPRAALVPTIARRLERCPHILATDIDASGDVGHADKTYTTLP